MALALHSMCKMPQCLQRRRKILYVLRWVIPCCEGVMPRFRAYCPNHRALRTTLSTFPSTRHEAATYTSRWNFIFWWWRSCNYFSQKTKLIVNLFLTRGVMEEFSKNNSSQHGENLKSPLATWRKWRGSCQRYKEFLGGRGGSMGPLWCFH